MLMKFALAASAAVLIATPLLAEQAADPFGWLEEIEGARALDWARAENARTLPVLESDPRFAPMRAEARSILTSPARIPTGSIHDGAVYNFWQDDVHVRGVWRRASVATYRKGKPAWETLIDFDQLARDEGENWISGQFVCLSPEYRHCMVETVARRRRHVDLARVRHDGQGVRQGRVRPACRQVRRLVGRRRHARSSGPTGVRVR